MNPIAKIKSLICPSGIKVVIETYGDDKETIQYTFWGVATFSMLTPDDRIYIARKVQEMVGGS